MIGCLKGKNGLYYMNVKCLVLMTRLVFDLSTIFVNHIYASSDIIYL